MIVEWVLDWLQTALEWLLSLFPSTGIPTWTGHLSTVLSYLGDLNYFLPIAETVTLVVGVLVVFPVFLGVSLSLWVIAQLRGSSSSG